MGRLTVCLLFCLLLCLAVPGVVGAENIVEPPQSCEICGMNRALYARSRMVILHEDGTKIGVCSIHCAAEVAEKPAKKIKSLMVADYPTKTLIDARTAVWVVGGITRGVMTSVPKWAFAGAGEARSFILEYGGETASYETVMKAAVDEVRELAAQEMAVEQEMLSGR